MSTGVINSKNTFSGVIKDKQTLEGSLNLNATPPSAFKDADDLVTKSTISFKNNRVNRIANNVFSYNHNLVSVDIPNVEVINSQAFKSCDALTSVNIPKCNLIRDEGFMNATALTKLELPAENVKVGNSSFEGCTSLEEVVAPNMTSVGLNAFKGCSSLKSVNYPKARVGSYAFQNCNLDTVVLSGYFGGVDSATTGTGSDTDSGAGVFANSTIKNLKLTKLARVSMNVFNSFNVSELVDLDIKYIESLEGLTYLRDWIGNTINGNSWTAKAPKLQSVDLSLMKMTEPNASIGARCFKEYLHLKKAEIPDLPLVYESFQSCPSLEYVRNRSLTIPAACFHGDRNLSRINVDPNCASSEGTFYFTDDYGEGFKIDGSAFGICKALKVLILPSSTISIGQDAFKSCNNLSLVFFEGSYEQWNNIPIGSGNECLLNARIICDATFEQYLYYINGLGNPIQ